MSSIAKPAPRVAADPSDEMPALAVRQVSHAYGPHKALKDVSLTVPQSRFTSLLETAR